MLPISPDFCKCVLTANDAARPTPRDVDVAARGVDPVLGTLGRRLLARHRCARTLPAPAPRRHAGQGRCGARARGHWPLSAAHLRSRLGLETNLPPSVRAGYERDTCRASC